MTFLKLYTGRCLDENKKIAEYFRGDIQYFLNVSEDIGLDVKKIKELEKTCSEAIKEDKAADLSDREKRLITAVFVGDAEWNQPIAEWYPYPMEKTLEWVDSKAHKKGLDMAREYGDISLVTFPNYTTPSEYDIDKQSLRQFLSLENPNIPVIGIAILLLEWYIYVAKEMGIDVEEFNYPVKREIIDYYSGKKEDLSEKSNRMVKSLFINSVTWISNLEREYKIDSFSLDQCCRELKKEAEKLQGNK